MKKKKTYSLLWKTSTRKVFLPDEFMLKDLNLEGCLQEYSPDFFCEIPIEYEDILFRQDILNDFLEQPGLLEKVRGISENCFKIKEKPSFPYQSELTIYNLLNRMDRVTGVMAQVEELNQVLKFASLHSEGLMGLSKLLSEMITHPLYVALKRDINEIKGMPSEMRSIQLGVNLDRNLKATSVVLLSLKEEPVFYSRLLKKAAHEIVHRLDLLASLPRLLFFPDTIAAPDPMTGMEKMMGPALQQLIRFCDGFMESLLELPASLHQELPFYSMGIGLKTSFSQKGFHSCLPKISPSGVTKLESLYNINLTCNHTEDQVVYNDLTIEEKGCIYILTGANRGGKTTFTQAIGQIQCLAQLGLMVPCKRAEIRIVDGIYLHFPKEETLSDDYGRLGFECKMFSDLYDKMTARSLLLMNEPFAGTSHLESLTIAKQVVDALRRTFGTVILCTHLHELGTIAVTTKKDPDQTTCISLVTGNEGDHRSFKIIEGEPLSKSYARDIAKQYGVTFEQLIAGSH